MSAQDYRSTRKVSSPSNTFPTLETGHANTNYTDSLSNNINFSRQSPAYEFSYLKLIFVVGLFILSLITFVVQTEYISLLYSDYKFDEPILLLYLTHGSWWALWPLQFIAVATFKTFKRYRSFKLGYNEINGKRWKGFRKSFASSVKAQFQNIFHTIELTANENISNYEIVYKDPKKSFKHYSQFFKSEAFKYIFKMSCLLCIVLNVAGLTWYIAMSLSSGSDVTAIYNCSAFTTYIFAIPILNEKFSWIKANSVLTAIIGVFVVAYLGNNSSADNNADYPNRLLGNLIIFIGAILYGLYEVYYKKWCCPPSEIVSARRQATFSNFIMCLIGINTFFLLGSGLLIVELIGLHHFKFPTNPKVILIIIVSVFSNMLFSVSFLGLMSLTSPVLSSVSSLVTILIVGLFEWKFRDIIITAYQLIGYLFIIIGFTLLTYECWNEVSQEDTEDDDFITDSESMNSSVSI